MANVREYTNRLLELVDNGIVDEYDVIIACLNYMSEDDVRDMCIANEFIDDYDNEDGYDDEDDDQ